MLHINRLLTIPEVRVQLLKLAETMPEDLAGQIKRLEKHMWRRKAIRRAKTQSKPITPQLSAAIVVYWREHPELSQQKIATLFGVDKGRVSEAVAGFRR